MTQEHEKSNNDKQNKVTYAYFFIYGSTSRFLMKTKKMEHIGLVTKIVPLGFALGNIKR